MNIFRVILLTLFFALTMLFFAQNSANMHTTSSLTLDLWWVKLSSPALALYVLVIISLLAGIIFGSLTYLPGNRYLQEKNRQDKQKIKNLSKEITIMEKIREESMTKEVPNEREHPLHEQEDMVKSSGSSAGVMALISVFAVFVVLVVFYYYTDQQFSKYQDQLQSSVKQSKQAAEKASEVEKAGKALRDEMNELKTQDSKQTAVLKEHSGKIKELEDLPQKTVDYMNMMVIKEYAAKIDQLLESSVSDQDRKMLMDARKPLEKLLKSYENRLDDQQ
ncbi:MAG: LapA family protein [Desulfonatronovibrionaceae bacterium]